jgi:hypothetical protein
MKKSFKKISALALLAAVLPGVAVAQTNYTDNTGETISSSILDIASVEVSNNAFDVVFKINLVGNPVATDWGKYLIAFDTIPGGDTAGNGWGRPISMASGMDYWVGAWVDGGNGGQIWQYSGSWSQTGSSSVSKTTSSVTISVPMVSLGVGISNSFDFDIYTTGGGGGDGAIDALSRTNQSIANWGDSFSTTNNRTYTIVPVPTPTNRVTFSVDLGVPIAILAANPSSISGFDTNSDQVYIRGSFNGWGATPNRLYQVGSSTVYTNTFDVISELGNNVNYKFHATPFPSYGYEVPQLTCGGDRVLTITNANQSAPLAYWNDSTVTDPTNVVTLQVDMAVPLATGSFVPPGDTIYARGDFNNWSEPGLVLTNVPSTTLYAGTLELPYFPAGGCKPLTYKFVLNNNYETGNNRQTNVTTMNPTLTSSYNNLEICDVIEQTNQVTFSVNLAGAVGTDTTVYDGSQSVYLNGDFAGWWGWGDTNNAATNYLMSKSGDIYSLTVPLPPGNNLRLNYKYSMDGADNEAGFAANHVRYIRTLPGQTSYSLPLDKWTGTNVNNLANLQEPKFGQLVAIPGAPGQVQLQWLGLKCVQLQAASNLAPAVWTSYTNSSGLSGTNLPSASFQQFFRLVDPSP